MARMGKWSFPLEILDRFKPFLFRHDDVGDDEIKGAFKALS